MENTSKRKWDVAVWTAEHVIEQMSDPIDAIEWLVMNLKDSAFDDCAKNYDYHMNELMNQSNDK